MLNEINRCLQCPKPKCELGCPLKHDIKAFINAAKTSLTEARDIIDKKNMLSSFCSMVCPHDLQCEGHCVLNKAKKPIRVGQIEQYIVNNTTSKLEFKKINKKVLVIGGGPAGVSFAYLAIKHQMDVTIYEKTNVLGGIPIYSIPNFRINKNEYHKYLDFVKENAKIKYNHALGINFKLEDVINDYDHIYLAVGSDQAKMLKIDGNQLNNIVSARYVLERYNDNELDLNGMDVVVIGAGNVAMDVARAAIRSKAKSSTIVYRRSLAESPASIHEIEGAKEDNVEFKFLNSPKQFFGENDVTGLEVEIMKLVEVENERPKPVGTNEFDVIKTNYIIVAIGQDLPSEILNDSLLKYENYELTSLNNKIILGGDLVNGPSSVAYAIHDSYKAIKKITEDFLNE